MSNNNKTPAIRFKGFTDTWEQRKLGEVADIVGGGTPSTSNDDYWDGDIDWYAPAEIADQIYVASSERKITQQGYDNSSAKMLPVGTVLFTSRAGIGKTAILRKEGCTNQGFQSIVPHINELDSYFIFSRSEEMKRYGETVGAGSTFVEVSGKQMANMELMMPITMEEQVTIGSFFSNLDFLITLHQRKCDKLIQFKAAMLKKMFTQNGADKPEIRFKGFTDAWEQRKVQDVADRFDNLRIPVAANLRVHGTTPYYGANGIQDYVEGFTHDGEFVLVAEDGANDLKNYPVKCVNGRIWVNNHAHVLQGKAGIADNSFLAFAISQSDIESLLVGGGRAKLNAEALMSIEFRLPCLQEQYRIGEYLTQLDNLITLHQRKCDKYKSIKAGLIRKLFP
ncbi:restriction endonuclease subunit S [Ruminococcus sp.]|uniref:restriction endonuclease subunit S n=1 Tax=Ruminococcus sp. TaxID=41978 RepID=UPI00257F43D3|nr:restriction endonuclease subunit S [Ruminococcus sp.]